MQAAFTNQNSESKQREISLKHIKTQLEKFQKNQIFNSFIHDYNQQYDSISEKFLKVQQLVSICGYTDGDTNTRIKTFNYHSENFELDDVANELRSQLLAFNFDMDQNSKVDKNIKQLDTIKQNSKDIEKKLKQYRYEQMKQKQIDQLKQKQNDQTKRKQNE